MRSPLESLVESHGSPTARTHTRRKGQVWVRRVSQARQMEQTAFRLGRSRTLRPYSHHSEASSRQSLRHPGAAAAFLHENLGQVLQGTHQPVGGLERLLPAIDHNPAICGNAQLLRDRSASSCKGFLEKSNSMAMGMSGREESAFPAPRVGRSEDGPSASAWGSTTSTTDAPTSTRRCWRPRWPASRATRT